MDKLGPLITTHDLAKYLRLDRALPLQLTVLDASWHNPTTKRNTLEEYLNQHIPGAAVFDINECCDKSSPYSVTLPSADIFEAYVGKLGIDNTTHVIVYDTYNGLRISSRSWWMFRVFGHDKVSVLEGGLTKWIADGYKVTSASPTIIARKFKANFKSSLQVQFEEIYCMMKEGHAGHVMDSRPCAWFFGMDYPQDEKWKSWHIPGSVNIPWTEFLNEDKLTMKSREELVHLFKTHNIDLNGPIKSTCRRGIYACLAALAAFVAGGVDIPVYDGSWEEFSCRVKKEEYMTDI